MKKELKKQNFNDNINDDKFYISCYNHQEYLFYLSMILYNKFLNGKYLLLDVYYDKIQEITKDYWKYDKATKSLIESIDNYIETRKDFILEKLSECVED